MDLFSYLLTKSSIDKKNVLEIGSNENGEYIKFKDGLLICTKTKVFTTTINTAWGSMYESASLSIGDYAYEFKEKPFYINGHCVGTRACLLENITGSSKSSFGNTYLYRPTNYTTEYAFTVNFIAIGTWK